jgi:hypothetical protein
VPDHGSRALGAERDGGGGGEPGRDEQPDGRGHHEALVRTVEEHAWRGECVQGEETGRGEEGERDEEQARVRPAERHARGRERERRADESGREDEPEVRGVVLPGEVDARRREQQHKAGERDGHEGHPRHEPVPRPRRRRQESGGGLHL